MRAPDGGASSTDETWYQLDGRDRIVAVGGRWRAFALENGGGEALAGDGVLGTRIYDHVSGHFTGKFLKEFFHRARLFGSATRGSYRCDAPHVKRLMEMRAQVTGDCALRVTHRTLDERPLAFPIPLVDVSKRAIAAILRCSICNRLRRGSAWREPEDSVEPGTTRRVVHTVCSDCRNGFSARDLWCPAVLASHWP